MKRAYCSMPRLISGQKAYEGIYYKGRFYMNAVTFDTAVLDGKIEIPPEYRRDFSSFVKVILIEDESRKAQNAHAVPGTVEKRIAALNRLAGIASEHPMSLEEIRAERLSRQ
jgi:hypothetical protein